MVGTGQLLLFIIALIINWYPIIVHIVLYYSYYRCEFGGQKCGAENFTTTITNFGVCFTFNSAVNNESLSVDIAGRRTFTLEQNNV